MEREEVKALLFLLTAATALAQPVAIGLRWNANPPEEEVLGYRVWVSITNQALIASYDTLLPRTEAALFYQGADTNTPAYTNWFRSVLPWSAFDKPDPIGLQVSAYNVWGESLLSDTLWVYAQAWETNWPTVPSGFIAAEIQGPSLPQYTLGFTNVSASAEMLRSSDGEVWEPFAVIELAEPVNWRFWWEIPTNSSQLYRLK